MRPTPNHLATLDPNSTLARAYLLMEKFKCEFMLVASEGQIVGVISMAQIEKLVQAYSARRERPASLRVGNFMMGLAQLSEKTKAAVLDSLRRIPLSGATHK